VTYTQIRVCRTYNTMNYTSQRFELEADLEEDEPVEEAMNAAARDLDVLARRLMRQQGLRAIYEQDGEHSLLTLEERVEAGIDDIPF